MTIARNVDQEKQLTAFTIFGDKTYEDIMEILNSFYKEAPTKNLLWDLRNASIRSFTTEQLQALVNFSKQQGEVRKGGKTACVVLEDFEFGLLRQLEAFGFLAQLPVDFKVSRSIDEAIEWFGEVEQDSNLNIIRRILHTSR